jgi:hypothetical protein
MPARCALRATLRDEDRAPRTKRIFHGTRKGVPASTLRPMRFSSKAPDMNADAWNQLAERSRTLVHHASRLMGVLTHPTQSHDEAVVAPIAAESAAALESLLGGMAAAPELAAHTRTIQRFDIALAAWRRSVREASALAPRYQTALLQQAAQGVTSCLHVEALSASEAARVLVARGDLGGRAGTPPP